jgi:hypothetical protein
MEMTNTMVLAAQVTCMVRNPYGFDANSCIVRSAHYRVCGLCCSNSQAARMQERWHRVACPSQPADAVDAPAKGPEAAMLPTGSGCPNGTPWSATA